MPSLPHRRRPSGRLKLADFGLSHIAARAASARPDDVAKDPSIVGTPFYMAPETIRGKSRGNETAADWWSFGVITYEFLLGFPPFQGGKVGEIYRAILSLAFAAPISHCSVSGESADLISHILVPDPRRAYALPRPKHAPRRSQPLRGPPVSIGRPCSPMHVRSRRQGAWSAQ